MTRTDAAVRVISPSPDRVFDALTDSDALAAWLPPYGCRARFEHFDARFVKRAGGQAPGLGRQCRLTRVTVPAVPENGSVSHNAP